MLSNQVIANFLREIPQSNQDKKALQNTYKMTIHQSHIDTLFGVAKVLHLLGVICLDEKDPPGESLIRASSQTAKYALMSFADYFERNESIIPDWQTRGIQDNPIKNGASFLKLIEEERANRFENAPPSRFVKVAQAFIKRINPDTHQQEILFQFDVNANQYQLIGGRWSEKDGDDLKQTIIREIEEELPLNTLSYPDTYQVHNVIESLTIAGSVSTTFGALTHYTFSFFSVTGLPKQLKLMPEDHWVPIHMILEGVVSIGGVDYPFANPEIFQRINQSLPEGLIGLPTSFD